MDSKKWSEKLARLDRRWEELLTELAEVRDEFKATVEGAKDTMGNLEYLSAVEYAVHVLESKPGEWLKSRSLHDRVKALGCKVNETSFMSSIHREADGEDPRIVKDKRIRVFGLPGWKKPSEKSQKKVAVK